MAGGNGNGGGLRLIVSDFAISFMWVWSGVLYKMLAYDVLGFHHDAAGEAVKCALSIVNMFFFAYLGKLTKGGTYNPLTVLSTPSPGISLSSSSLSVPEFLLRSVIVFVLGLLAFNLLDGDWLEFPGGDRGVYCIEGGRRLRSEGGPWEWDRGRRGSWGRRRSGGLDSGGVKPRRTNGWDLGKIVDQAVRLDVFGLKDLPHSRSGSIHGHPSCLNLDSFEFSSCLLGAYWSMVSIANKAVLGSIVGVRFIIESFPEVHGPRLTVDLHRGALTEGFLTFAIVIISLGLYRNIPGSFYRKTWISSVSKVALHILGSDLTGGVMNPASVMGWAYARGDHWTKEHILVYWLAPIEATLLAKVRLQYPKARQDIEELKDRRRRRMGSFYKIILPSVMVYHRLRIPEDFSKKYGDELSTSVRFTVRSGQVWRVGVEKADEMLWFTDGWKEFSESHSIGCGFFLVFNYEGNSEFKDMYEFAPEFAIRINKRGRCISSLESLRCNFQYFTRNKRYKMEDHGKIVEADSVTLSWKSKMKASEMSNSQRPSVQETEKEKWNVMKNVDNLPAAVPFGRKCCLSDGARLKRHINRQDKEGHKQLDSVFVQEATRKSKRIRYQLNETKHTKSVDKLNSSNAANNRRTDSNGQQLKVKCEEEEELLGLNDFSNDSMMRPVKTQEREKAVNASMMFKPNNPFFRTILQPYNVHRSFILNLPARFAKKYLHGVSESIQLEVSGGKQWTVCCVRINGPVEDVVLKVSIFRVMIGECNELATFVIGQPGYDSEEMLYSSVGELIPLAFVGHVKGRMPDKVFLRNRHGKLWPVKVTKVGNHLNFSDGWVKFAEDSSLEFGDFLVFDYDGTDVFHFKIFGRTGCEKEVIGSSHLTVNNEEQEEVEEEYLGVEEEEDDLEVEEEEEEEEEEGEYLEVEEAEDDLEVEECREENEYAVEEQELEATTLRNGNKRKAAVKVEDDDDIFEYGMVARPKNPYFVAKLREKRRNELDSLGV
ncbi:hypothetical protein C3L33_15998, partial [Rhododendron williamsianum]